MIEEQYLDYHGRASIYARYNIVMEGRSVLGLLQLSDHGFLSLVMCMLIFCMLGVRSCETW